MSQNKADFKQAIGCTAVVLAIFIGGTTIIATAIGCLAFLRWLWWMVFA